MIVDQELFKHGDEYKLENHINSDDVERENWRQVQEA